MVSVAGTDEVLVDGGVTGVGVDGAGGKPRPNPGIVPEFNDVDGCIGTTVGGDKLVSGTEAKSAARKFRPSMATGISEETVSSNGVEKGPGGDAKNSFRYLAKWPKGPSRMVVLSTIVPTLSVRMKLIPPAPAEGFATAMAVVFSDIGPTGTNIEAVVSKGDGGTIVC
jgi:hypothetical protein